MTRVFEIKLEADFHCLLNTFTAINIKFIISHCLFDKHAKRLKFALKMCVPVCGGGGAGGLGVLGCERL